MREIKTTLRTMHLLIFVWSLSLMFSAAMFTISIYKGEIIPIYIFILSGVLSCIGIFYTAYLIFRIDKFIKNKTN